MELGGLLAWVMGYSVWESWIVASLVLYFLVGLCWLPVVWIQLQLRDIAAYAARQGAALPAGYFALFRVWFWLGWPAFGGVRRPHVAQAMPDEHDFRKSASGTA